MMTDETPATPQAAPEILQSAPPLEPQPAAPAESTVQSDSLAERTRRRAREIAEIAARDGLPPGSVARAMRTGMRDPSVDVDDPTKVPSTNPHLTGVTDEETAKARAKQLGYAVPIPSHHQGHVARPDGSVGPYQRP